MRIYTVELEIAALNPAAGDGIIIIESASTKVLQVIRAALYNLEAASHAVIWAGVFPITTKGSLAGASTPAAQKLNAGDPAFAGTTYGAGNAGMTTEPTTWGDPYDEQGVSNLTGYEWEPAFDLRPIIAPSGLFGLRLMAAPAAAYKAKALVTFGEL